MKRYGVLDWAVAALMVVLVLVVFAQVALRYLTYQPLAWTEEAARFCFIWLCLLGAAVASRRGAHFAVDYLPRRLTGTAGRLLVAAIRFAEAGLFVVVTWSGLAIVEVAHGQRSPTLGIPMSVPYGAVLLGGLLMCLFSLHQGLQALRLGRRRR